MFLTGSSGNFNQAFVLISSCTSWRMFHNTSGGIIIGFNCSDTSALMNSYRASVSNLRPCMEEYVWFNLFCIWSNPFEMHGSVVGLLNKSSFKSIKYSGSSSISSCDCRPWSQIDFCVLISPESNLWCLQQSPNSETQKHHHIFFFYLLLICIPYFSVLTVSCQHLHLFTHIHVTFFKWIKKE